MHCSYTQRRAIKLYKFNGIDHFCHRTAVHPLPTYASQRVSGLARVMDQRWRLRERMGDDFSDLFGGPVKPKWMRWSTFEKWEMKDSGLSQREDRYASRFLRRLTPP
jgi:hypothetical protein